MSTVKEDMEYVNYIVHQYLRGKPNLEEFREDLRQEGMLTFYEASSKFDPSFGKDFKLYIFYAVTQACMNYINRVEAKHFKGAKVERKVYGNVDEAIEEHSQRWDLPEPIKMEEIDAEEDDYSILYLKELIDKVELTTNEGIALELYLKDLDKIEIAKEMNISKQRASQLIDQVTTKLKKVVS